MSEQPRDILHRLRNAELESVRQWFREDARVLEIGGGDGYQASVLSSWGCHVTSIDVASPNRATFFPVALYDGKTLPFEHESFDVVFSSNVLEHVLAIDALLAEIRRVQRRSGRGVHLMPSSSWRAWTILSHYPWLMHMLLRRGRARDRVGDTDLSASYAKNSVTQLAVKALGLQPHGEYENALTELYHYRRGRWERLLRTAGFELIHSGDNGLFYTGNALFPSLSIGTRKKMASALGASCNLFVTR